MLASLSQQPTCGEVVRHRCTGGAQIWQISAASRGVAASADHQACIGCCRLAAPVGLRARGDRRMSAVEAVSGHCRCCAARAAQGRRAWHRCQGRGSGSARRLVADRQAQPPKDRTPRFCRSCVAVPQRGLWGAFAPSTCCRSRSLGSWCQVIRLRLPQPGER